MHRARPLPPNWPSTGKWIEPQGRHEQGWPAHRCSPEVAYLAPQPAEAATEVGHDDGEPLTRAEALRVWLWMCVPAIGSGALLALILWVTQP